jgi:hypothetical protein
MGPFEVPEGAEYSTTFPNDGKSRELMKHIDIFRRVIQVLQLVRVMNRSNFTHFFMNCSLLAISCKLCLPYVSHASVLTYNV